jgi:hypothetical protein
VLVLDDPGHSEVLLLGGLVSALLPAPARRAAGPSSGAVRFAGESSPRALRCSPEALSSSWNLSHLQLKRTGRDSIELIRTNLMRLGKTLCYDMHSTVSADILAGPEGGGGSDTTVSAAFERWSAQVAVRLIRCDSLALRVKGASDLRELVDQASV